MDGKLLQKFTAIFFVFGDALHIIKSAAFQKLFDEKGHHVFTFMDSLVFHTVQYITHSMRPSFLWNAFVQDVFKAVIVGHHAQKLQGFLYMMDLLLAGNVVAIFSFLYEIVCDDPKIAPEQLYLLFGKICDLE